MSEIDELRARVDVLAAREDIRDVLFAYTRAMDRGDVEGIKACYHDDADDIHWGTFIGNAHEFAEYMTHELREVKLVTHEVTNPIIDLDGDRAFVESRYSSRVRIAFDGAEPGQWVESVADGRYLDLLDRRAGKWKIAHRRIVQEGGHVAVILDPGSYNPGAGPLNWPDDLVYRGFDVRTFAPAHVAGTPDRFAGLRAFGERIAETSY